MASVEHFEVVKIEGLRYEGRRRGVGFLVSADRKVDAKQTYESLSEKKREDLLNRFDYWLDGGKHDDYFHGWPNDPDHKNCWSFRWRENKVRHRLYGFLYKPADYQVCVLTSHGAKTQEHTDPKHLDRAEVLRANVGVIRAIEKTFPEVRKKL